MTQHDDAATLAQGATARDEGPPCPCCGGTGIEHVTYAAHGEQQERFKWAANERADKAEADLAAALALLAALLVAANGVPVPLDRIRWRMEWDELQRHSDKARAFLAAHPVAK